MQNIVRLLGLWIEAALELIKAAPELINLWPLGEF